uniref:Torsin-1A-interacting protein 1/2 AAA+ activator domain-containing protein n=1 Tax=Cyprinus carpio carpio TaxID=630221 RepID=A0A9J8AWF5_CYPCA
MANKRNSDAVQQRTDSRSDPGHDTKRKVIVVVILRRNKQACQVILCQIMHLKRMMRTQECLPFNFQMLCSRELSLGLTQDMIQQRKVRVAVILRKNKQKRQHRFTVVLRPRTTLTLAQDLRETWTEKRAVNLREKKACQVILCQMKYLKRMMMLCSRELTLGLTQDMIQQRKVRLVVILRRKKRTKIRSSSETKKHSHPGTGPKRDMDREKGRKPERKGSSVDSLPDNVPKEDDGGSGLQEINKVFWTAAAVVLLAVVCALWQRSPDSTPPVQKEINVVDVFNQEMKKLETAFPNQHPELWRRSLIHLRRHLKTKNPTEPVSLILTSDHRAEKTLGCLAQCLARAFSTAHNTSVLNINGKNKTSHDSDQVKLDIDSELTKAFEGKKSAAVIHHFEELPPGSTLIFYRYCDHENAAYKDVFLVFTVMLDPEVELTSNDSLRRVGEMVKEHIKQKFVSSDKSAMFNQMDVDKLGGLWTRIAHLILPVAAEKKIEKQGCGDCESPLNIQKPEEEDTASVIHEEDVERDENVQAQIIVPVNNKKTTDIHSSSETENHPQSGTGPKRDMDREKGRKPERKEGLSGDSLPDNAPKEDDDAVQQGTDSTGHDTTEKSESSSEPEEKQTGPSVDSLPDNAPKEDDEKTTDIRSSSETENHPQSGTGPKRDMDREKGRKPERKEGLSGDSLPDNAPKEDDDAVQQGTDSTGHDTTEKSERSTEPEEKQTGPSVDSLPDNAPKEDDEKTTHIHSSSETENHPQSGTGPKRDMDREKGLKPERKEGLSGDPFPDNAPKEDDDAVQQGTDSRSDPGHDTTEKSESSSELEEKQTGPSVDSLPDNAPKEDDESPLNIQKPEEEDTASDIHEEDVERDENVQPQIIVPVNNKKTTHIHSSSETENHPQSGTGPKRDMDREKGRKPERKEGKVKSLSAVI